MFQRIPSYRLMLTVFSVMVMALVPACAMITPVPAAAPAQPAAAEATPTPAEGAKWCSGVRIVFFPGGPAGGVFAVNVYNGARQAEMDLGPKVDYVWSDWDPQKMIQQFREAVATMPDGIAIMGHPGDEAFGPLIDDAIAKGIIVTSQNTDLPQAEAKYKDKGFGYVGQELYPTGYALGKEAVKRFGLKAGDRAMVWGLLSQPTRGLRTKGVIDALEEEGLVVDYIEIDAATNKDPAAGTPTFTGYVSAHPDVKLVVTDHGGLTATLETYLKAAGKGPDDIYAAGFDLSPATVAAIRGGWTDLVIDQQPWLQGYLPILQICLTKIYGFSGLHIDTGGGFASKENIDFLAPLAEKNIR
ncbi:MAG: substrate-binding domain-containing protein [Anaerolineae bacterium]|nr:substrate-binding domain-containing protein [Anaerolineae bacterium]MDW8099594.1 substrate-binding domain-containing protein [Anaerolineae bacterium]